MARAAATLCALVCMGCSRNPYVIGHELDAGARDSCASAHPGAVFCSGFELSKLSDWGSPVLENAAEVGRSTARAHSGRASLHASSSAGMSQAALVANFPPVLGGDLYLRTYVYVPAGLPTQTMNIFFLGAKPVPDPFVGIDFNLEQGAVQVYSPQGNPQRQTGTLTIPRDRWFCFRARIVISHTRGEVQAFVDDAPALDATHIDTLPPAGVDELRVGIDWSSDQSAFFELYVDDLVLDTAPVACQ
jgi:hypothetical protein